jgi:hypothetical protein
MLVVVLGTVVAALFVLAGPGMDGGDAEMRALLGPISESEAAMVAFTDAVEELVLDASENGNGTFGDLEAPIRAELEVLSAELLVADLEVCSTSGSLRHRAIAEFQAAYCAHLEAWVDHSRAALEDPRLVLNADPAITTTFLDAIDAAQQAKRGRAGDIQDDVDRLFRLEEPGWAPGPAPGSGPAILNDDGLLEA